MENGNFRRIYSGQVNQTEDGLDCINWREVNGSQTWEEDGWLTGDHNYCRNPDWEELREFCYVNQTQRGFCAVKTCGKITVTTPARMVPCRGQRFRCCWRQLSYANPKPPTSYCICMA